MTSHQPLSQPYRCPNVPIRFSLSFKKYLSQLSQSCFPPKNKCHNCHNCHNGDIGDKCPNGDIGDKCPNGDKSRMTSHVCELRSVPTLDGIASRSCSARATLAGSPWEQLHATM